MNFGEEFYFQIFGKPKYTTSFGGVLTFLTRISTIIITILFGIDLIKRSNPKIIIERIISPNYNYLNFTLQNFPIFGEFPMIIK
jgi:Gpi18-like mannosyltransferase